MIQDIRYAFRTLRKSPGFTAATALTLALGIGANAAMFSIVNAVVLKPLPFKSANELTIVWAKSPVGQRNFVSQPDLEDWRAMSNTGAKTFSGFAGMVAQSVNLTGGETPDRIVGSFVSANYFDVLRIDAAKGRTFSAGEDQPGAELTAVLTDRIWHSKFAGDPKVVGRKVQFNGEPYTVVGVLPTDFVDQPWDADAFLPLFKYPNYAVDRAQPTSAVIGRMRPGVRIEQAQAEMSGIAARLAADYPATNKGTSAIVMPLKELVVEDLKPTVAALAGAVGFVLLIACANVAGLFASRIVARERERAVRLALGASRGQLISNVIAEALVLAVIGGGAGLALAAFGIAAVSSAIANQLPAGTKLALDPMVVMFTAGIAILSALLIAAIPAWQAHGGAGGLVLREGRNAGAGSARNWSRSILAAAEIAMAMVLLIGAGLTIKSLLEMGRAKTGFDTRNLLTFEYRVPKAKYPSDGAQNEFHKRVIEEIRAIPGVIAASSVRAVPLAGNGSTGPFVLLDRPEPPAAERPQAMLNVADPYFFSTMRIPVLRGRDFSEHDTNHSAHVVVINQTMATRYFQERDPIGQSIRIPPANNMTAQIVGVVGDVKQFSNTDLPVPQIYGVLSQNPFVFASVAVRTATDPNSLMPEIRRAVWRVDKDQPMWKMRTADARLAMLAQPQQLMSSLLGGYAGLALLLAAIGIFGVISYSVSQRTAEIGVRMALGASPGDVAKVILQQGVIVIGIGITVGLGAAAWLTQFLKSQLYAVSTLDASVYAIVAGVLGTVSLAACWIPARRAMKVDPVVALRAE